MSLKIRLQGVLAGLALAALAGCSQTVFSTGDYPWYDEEDLVAQATVVVTGTPVSSEPTVLTPRFEGDNPEENPLVGLSEEEIERAIAEAEGVPATAVTFKVDESYRGPFEPGQEITVVQTGGTVGNTTYVIDQEPPLEEGERYLLFMRAGFDETFVILGGSAGMFAEADDAFVPVLEESSPFTRLTREDLDSILK